MSTQTPTKNIAQIIFGTAGHVDHGKTSLVIALTSFNTDRHPEERKRGISIDFAVAPYTSKNGTTIGIVDIPGHEDFIKNAISGASGVDVIILVVAADDGIMPQTREHLLIATDLGANLIIPVITKIDLVAEDRIKEVQSELESLIDSYSCKRTETIYTSATNGEGIEKLKSVLNEIILNYKKPKDCPSFRMFIRSCFIEKGFGKIVTGIPDSGSIKTGDILEVISSHSSEPQEIVVKRIENYRNHTDETKQHISSAINIRDIDIEYLERGAILCTKGIYTSSKSILAYVTSHINTLNNDAQAMFHIGTMKRAAQLYFLDKKTLNIGESAITQIKLAIPVALRAGDKFILRTETTIAAGTIINRNGKLPKRALRPKFIDNANQAYLQINTDNGHLISELLTSNNYIVDEKLLYKYSLGEKVDTSALSLYQIGRTIWINLYKKSLLLDKTKQILERYHKAKPQSPGIHIKLLLTMISGSSSYLENIDFYKVSLFLKENINNITIEKETVSLQSFKIALSDLETKYLDQITQIILDKKFTSKGFLEKEHKIDQKVLNKLLRILENKKFIISTQSDIFLISLIEEIKNKLSVKHGKAPFTLAEFRSLSDLSRNYAVSLLEYFDGKGITKRIEDKRVLN